MKKLMLVSVVLCTLLVLSCDPDSITNALADANNAMTDPNSAIQLTAENLQEMIATGVILVKAVPGFPYAKALLGGLAIAQAILTMILGWRKRVTTTALKQAVRGNEILKKDLIKKGSVGIDEFRKAQDAAQDEKTVEIINKIRTKVA